MPRAGAKVNSLPERREGAVVLRPLASGFLAGAVLVWAAAPALAQMRTGGTGGGFSGSSGGGFLGSSGSGFGTTGFGSTGSGFGSSGSGSGGGFLGGASFGGTAGGGGRGSSGSTAIGSTSPFGPYYGNPLAIGFPSASPGSSSSSSSGAAQYQRAFPVTLSFNQPSYGNANLTTTSSTTGATGLRTTGTPGTPGFGQGGTGFGTGTGGTATVTTGAFPGASSAGIRRAPPYVTVPVFDLPERRPSEMVRTDLQQVVARSSRLPSRENIRVSVDGSVVVLRGQVRDERERRLAEAVVRTMPAVRGLEVRNLLEPAKKGR
jgi:hypothetical protein